MSASLALDALAVKLVGSRFSSRHSSKQDSADCSSARDERVMDMCSDAAFRMVHQMRDELRVRDRFVALKVERDTVLGSEIVSWLLRAGYASSKQEAEQIGDAMVEYGHLYQIGIDDGDASVGRFSGSAFPFRFSFDERDMAQVLGPAKLSALKVEFVQNMVRGYCRSVGNGAVPDVFTGSDATSVLLSSGFAQNRGEATRIGQVLLNQGVFFRLVGREQIFRDSPVLYRLSGDSPQRTSSVRGLRPMGSSDDSASSLSISACRRSRISDGTMLRSSRVKQSPRLSISPMRTVSRNESPRAFVILKGDFKAL